MTASPSTTSWLQSGTAAALASALLFGVTVPLAKELLHDAAPLLMAGLLYLGSGAGLLGWRLLRDRGWQSSGMARADWRWLGAATLFGGVLAPALLMVGLRRSDAATASLLLNLESVFGALIAWFVFREATSRRIVGGFVAILAGGIVLSWPSQVFPANRLPGLLCVAAACLCWGIDNNVTRKISAADARLIAGLKGAVAGCTSILLSAMLGTPWPEPKVIAAILTLGFLGYGVSLVLFILALRHLGTARSGAYFSTAPFIGVALSIGLFGQPVTGLFYAAAALMAAGVWLHVTEDHEHEHVHEPLTHTHPHRHDAHHQHEHGAEWDGQEPHVHEHRHVALRHRHAHFPDIHHRHQH